MTAGEPQAGGPARPAPAALPVSRPRLDHVDAVRPLKQFGVISTHSVLFFAPTLSVVAGGSLMLLHVSREAFFFVSACMLAYANPSLTGRDVVPFYKRRALSIALPYACWTLIYWATEVSFPFQTRPELDNLAHLTVTGYYQLYYLLVIGQFYLLYPFLLRLVTTQKHRPGLLIGFATVVQLLVVSLMHWSITPPWMQGYWANREIISYVLYLVAGCVLASHLQAFESWLLAHAHQIYAFTLVAALVAEVWYALAWYRVVGFLGPPSDPFQPIVVPFNAGAILSLYILGKSLVSQARSERLRRWVRVGSDQAYGIFLAQMVFIDLLVDTRWTADVAFLPWPVMVAGTAVLVFACCWATTWILSHTRMSRGLTGQRQIPWRQQGYARAVGVGVEAARSLRT